MPVVEGWGLAGTKMADAQTDGGELGLGVRATPGEVEPNTQLAAAMANAPRRHEQPSLRAGL